MPRLKGFRYPLEVIAYAVWACHRFALSTANVEDLLANPLKFSKTPVTYRTAPPVFEQDTDDVLSRLSDPQQNEPASLKVLE